MELEVIQSPLFEGLTKEEIRRLIERRSIQRRKFKRNECIFVEQQTPKSLFMLVEGSVGLHQFTVEGNLVQIASIQHPGDLFGEVYLFIAKPYEVRATAETETSVLELFLDLLPIQHEISKEETQIRYNLMRIFAYKAYHLQQRIQILASSTLREKICRSLMMQAKNRQVVLSMTKEEWAKQLNVARPSLSRELSALQQEGWIEVKGKVITILHHECLDSFR